MSERYDAIVIGAGQAGPSLAGRMTAAGMSVALIERKLLGGTCVNTGCMPTKALVASAKAAQMARRAADYGVVLDGTVRVDLPKAMRRAHTVTTDARAGVQAFLDGMKGLRRYEGQARFESRTEVRVGDALLSAERIFINVGGRALVPPLPGVDEVAYLTNTSMLELEALPRHLVVVGGSYVGLEFAQIFRRFGSEVTIVEKGPRLIAHEDEDVSVAVQGIVEAEGIAVRLSAECIRFTQRKGEVAVHVDCANGSPEELGSHVLLAVGRRPNTDDLGLDRAGVETDARGYILVDDQLRTRAPGIWALGDCNGRGAFTHTAYNDFEIVAANLLDHDPRRVSDRIVTYALYIDPPLGRVGLTETQARAQGKSIRVGRRPMTRVGRAVEKGETQGFMKIVVDADTSLILGASILGTGGDEAIHNIIPMLYAKAPYTTLQRAVQIHPTVSELIPTVLGELQP